MITMEDYKKMFLDDRENARRFSRSFRENVDLLKAIHQDELRKSNSPQKIIDEFVDLIGHECAVKIIANMVNARAKWDGRISLRNAEWAKEHAELDRDVVIHLGGYADDTIHSCHLNQLCSYMRSKAV